LGYGGFQFWSSHRPQPAGTRREIFPEVHYVREVRREEPRLVKHIVTIPLFSPNVTFVVTPADAPNAELPYKARTTSQFLKEFKVQLAINADFFYPWRDQAFLEYRPKWEDLLDPKSLPDKMWNYYPHPGDGVTTQGISASEGEQTNATAERRAKFPTLFLSKDNQAQFLKPYGAVYNAVSGGTILLKEGVRPPTAESAYFQERHPRTAVGIDKERRWLIVVVIDGRQPNYSEGATISELTDVMEEHGAWTALNFDGGGSTALVMEGKGGEPLLLNTPIDHRIPWRERPVANHLGIRIKKSGQP
jgi:hypothetical protein